MKSQRIITFICTMLLCASMAFAQTSGDKLYNQGLQLQKTMTINAQNQAIAKFKSAKNLYDSAAKKAQCDQAIQVSQGIIKQLKIGTTGGGGKKPGQTIPEPVVVEPTLDINPSNFDLPQEANTVQVTVATNQEEWSVTPVNDGSKLFAQATKGDNKITIYVMPNPTYEKRAQKFLVTAGDLIKEITITQSGKYVQLSVNEGILKFKLAGNKKKVEISCNSTQQYPENANENWYVASKPDWIVVTINQKKGGLLGKIKDKATQIVGGAETETDASIRKTTINVEAKPVMRGSYEAANGRQGEVVIQSGESTVTIYVTQSAN